MILRMFYIGCAAVGLFTLALQLLLSVFGLGDHDAADVHDFHGGDHHAGGFGLLSVRALGAFLAFFGLTGWWLTATGFGPAASAALSLAAGGAAMAAVGWLLSQQRRLDVEGNLDPKNAVGETATVYLCSST